MDAKNKVKVMAVLLVVVACGLTIPVAGDDDTAVDSQDVVAFGGIEAEQYDKTGEYILEVVISLAAVIFTIVGMLYIVQRMKNQAQKH